MSSLIRLVIAAVLAIVAGFCNFMWLSWQEKRHLPFVVLDKPVTAGTLFQASDFGEIKIPGDYDDLRKTFIPASQGKSLLVGVRATRDYNAGDIILHDHIQSEIPHWKALGSFRLLSVGERIRSGNRYSEGSGGNTVTIAAEVDETGNYDSKTQRLLDLVATQSDRKSEARIVAIQLDPSELEPNISASPVDSVIEPQETRLPLAQNERGIIIPLSNVESIPEVLVRGSNISFIVQWFEDGPT
ncbi:MAG: hypothetical protein HKN47_16745 [Pirellulaceae bacterium]|nr:hypothetical protein [Pirellulaceae bacterium]